MVYNEMGKEERVRGIDKIFVGNSPHSPTTSKMLKSLHPLQMGINTLLKIPESEE